MSAVTEDLWGVGRYQGAGGLAVTYAVGHDEIRRDLDQATRVVAEWGVGPGARVLWCTLLSESAQCWPWVLATMLAGAQLSLVDATRSDAVRLAMFARRLRYDAIVGIGSATLDGLDDLGLDAADVLGGVRIVGARPGAAARLESAGVATHHFMLCGPAVACGQGPGRPATWDDAEWELDTTDDGTVVVSALRPRATSFLRTPVGVRARLADHGLVPVPDQEPGAP